MLDFKESCLTFVRQHHPQALGCFHYGSTANGTESSFSDVDLIIVYDQSLTPYREKIRWNGWVFDTFVFDAESLHGSMVLARNNGNSVLAQSIKGSNIVQLMESSLLERLRRLAIRLADAPPLSRSVENQRQLLTSQIDDFRGATCEQSRCFVLIDIFNSLIDLVASKYGESGGTKRYASRLLALKDPLLLSALVESFKEAVLGNDDAFITLSESMLHVAGGQLRDGFKMRLPETLRIPID